MSQKEQEEFAEDINALLTSPLAWFVVGLFCLPAATMSAFPFWGRVGYAIMGAGMMLTFTTRALTERRNAKLLKLHEEKVKAWDYLTEEDIAILGEKPEFTPKTVDQETVIGVSVLLVIVGVIVLLIGL